MNYIGDYLIYIYIIYIEVVHVIQFTCIDINLIVYTQILGSKYITLPIYAT